MIREYLSEVTTKSLFMISRKEEVETYDRRYNETNANGLCGAINLFQLTERHKHGYSATSKYKNEALDFYNANTRDDFVSFLKTITPFPTSTEKEKILRSVQAMIDWAQQKSFTAGRKSSKKERSFPFEEWWHTYWYTEIQNMVPMTLFENTNYPAKEPGFLTVTLSSAPDAVKGFKFTFPQVQDIARQPNYCRHDKNQSHYLLELPVAAHAETKRMNQALVDLSKNILAYILNNFSPDASDLISVSKQLNKKEAADENPMQQSDDETVLSNFSLSINSDMSTALRPDNVARIRLKNKDTKKKGNKQAPTIDTKVIHHLQDSIDTSCIDNERTKVDLPLSLRESTTFLQEPILNSPSHSQSNTDISPFSSDESISDIPAKPTIYMNASNPASDKENCASYNLRRRIPKQPIAPCSPIQRRGARRTLKKHRLQNSAPASAKSERRRQNLGYADCRKSKSDDALLSDEQKEAYYSPQKIQHNILLEEQAQFQSPTTKGSSISDDLSKPHWLAIQSFDIENIGKHPTYTFKRLYSVGTQLGFIYDDITQKIVHYSSSSPYSNNDAFELYLKLWVLFSPLFLRVTKSSSISIIKYRINQFKSFQWEIMLSDLLKDCQEFSKPFRNNKRRTYKGAIPIEERSPESRYETAAVNFEDKNISKAYLTIVNPSKASSNAVSSESILALRDLHPQRKDSNKISEELLKAAKETVLPPLSTPETLWKIIRNLKNGTSPGVDGLRSEHLVSMARHGKAKWISNMSTIVNLALASALPTWLNDIFAYSKLIGLVKQTEENDKLKLRPIGIGMVWPKIISKTILNYYRPRATRFFEPFQFGLSKSGLESITHITKEALKEHPNWVLLRLDLVNAFNTILRKIIFEEVQKHFPLLLPWLKCLYGRFSHLWTKSENGSFYFPLSSEEGVKQGCTLGSFLFCLAIQNPVIKKINALLTSLSSDSSSIGLLDDINIIADPSALTHDFWKQIELIFADCGLSINMKKATLYTSTCSEDSLSILRSELPSSLKFQTDGVELVGTPIGNDAFCYNYWDVNLLQEMRIAIPLICSWPDVQRALCLFRLCVVSKYNYFLRHSDPRLNYSIEISETIHHLIANGLARILDPLTTEEFQNVLNERIWSQLIPEDGGLWNSRSAAYSSPSVYCCSICRYILISTPKEYYECGMQVVQRGPMCHTAG